MSQLLLGLGDALRPDVVLFVFLGVLLGYVVGVLPGLNRPAALAIAVPLSYYMSPLSAVAFLIGIAKASGAGGRHHGHPHQHAGRAQRRGHRARRLSAGQGRQGGEGPEGRALRLGRRRHPGHRRADRGGRAAGAAGVARRSGRAGGAHLAGADVHRRAVGPVAGAGLAAAFFGILVAMVGIDAETATPRLTFGLIELADGVPIMAITVGMLALTEMLIQAEECLTGEPEAPAELPSPTRADRALSWAETKSITPTTLLSGGVGIVAGIIPGLGPTVASFLAYALAKRLAKPGERFGEGEIKGVAAAETADNAVVPASLIPLFALGLPGSVSAAIIIAAFTVHGVTPGPRMFEEHGRLMYGIYGAMLVASLLMLVVGRVGLTAFAQLARIPATVIIPTVTALHPGRLRGDQIDLLGLADGGASPCSAG